MGNAAPEIAKAPPERFTEFTVTAAFPEEVSVSVLAEELLRFVFPKSILLALNVSWAALPVPVRATALLALTLELVQIVTVPLAVPRTVGSKLARRAIDCPGLNVTGKVAP